MKEDQFEVIVPAYDALESELEDILGGGCFIHKCEKEVNCKPNIGGGGDSGNCVEEGNILQNGQHCCPGLIAISMGGTLYCAKPVE